MWRLSIIKCRNGYRQIRITALIALDKIVNCKIFSKLTSKRTYRSTTSSKFIRKFTVITTFGLSSKKCSGSQKYSPKVSKILHINTVWWYRFRYLPRRLYFDIFEFGMRIWRSSNAHLEHPPFRKYGDQWREIQCQEYAHRFVRVRNVSITHIQSVTSRNCSKEFQRLHNIAHPGSNKMIDLIREWYTWSNIRKNIGE